MTAAKPIRRPGRPPRTTEPFKIRATVPDDHPLLPKLRELGPWMGAMYLLELAAGRIEAGHAAAAPAAAADRQAVSTANAVLGAQPSAPDEPQALVMTDDLAALFSFSGGLNG